MKAKTVLFPGNGPMRLSADGQLQAMENEPGTPSAIALPGVVDLSVRPEAGRPLNQWLAEEETFRIEGGLVHAVLEGLPIAHSSGFGAHGLDESGGRDAWRAMPRLTSKGHWDALADLAALRDAGVALIDAGDIVPSEHLNRLHRSLQLCAQYGLRVAIRPHMPSLAGALAVHAGAMAERYGLDGQPSLAETSALALLLEMAEATGCGLHLKRLSSARSIELLRRARRDGLDVSADVAIANLCFSEVDLGDLEPRFLADPPLRTGEDRDALLAAVADGTIDAVVSHHRAISNGDALIDGARPGHRAMHLLAPLMLHLAEQESLPLERAVAAITTAPATIAGLSLPQLKPGQPFNGVVFDHHEAGHIVHEPTSPWCGWALSYSRT